MLGVLSAACRSEVEPRTAAGMNMEQDWTCVVKHTPSQHINRLDVHAHGVPKCALFMHGLTHMWCLETFPHTSKARLKAPLWLYGFRRYLR
jgi:hypothetical protein